MITRLEFKKSENQVEMKWHKFFDVMGVCIVDPQLFVTEYEPDVHPNIYLPFLNMFFKTCENFNELDDASLKEFSVKTGCIVVAVEGLPVFSNSNEEPVIDCDIRFYKRNWKILNFVPWKFSNIYDRLISHEEDLRDKLCEVVKEIEVLDDDYRYKCNGRISNLEKRIICEFNITGIRRNANSMGFIERE